MVPTENDARNERLPDDRLWTITEAAKYLHVHPNTIRNRMEDSDFPYERVGRALRFRKADLDAWLEQHTEATEGAA